MHALTGHLFQEGAGGEDRFDEIVLNGCDGIRVGEITHVYMGSPLPSRYQRTAETLSEGAVMLHGMEADPPADTHT